MSDVTSEPQIPLNDLVRGTAVLREDIDSAIARVLDRGYFVLGPENSALEEELSSYLGVTDTVLVGNGTDALQLALTALGVTLGDTVMTVANAGGYTSTAVRALNAVPVYVDIEPDNHLLSVHTFAAALQGLAALPRAIVVTHLFGAVVDIEPIVAVAKQRGIFVVEDCAQGFGATRDGRKAGTFGDISTTSFYPTKNLGALGDGGAVFTSAPELASRVRRLRQYGWESKYRTTLAGGTNSRLDELQAAVLRVKLPHLDNGNSRRREIHSTYEAAVGSGARLVSASVEGFIGHLAVLEVQDRPRAQALFAHARITTDVHYPIPDHLQPVVDAGSDPRLDVTERVAGLVLSIPLFPELRTDEIERVCSVLGRI